MTFKAKLFFVNALRFSWLSIKNYCMYPTSPYELGILSAGCSQDLTLSHMICLIRLIVIN